ncbi:P-loop containing nucleoside triphosphate hydrolase protein [Kalaharituber pfeilii]|nr:P-loop containing nucleoside triphosphate hydrolase protein [Kalaharituber pfeilii]
MGLNVKSNPRGSKYEGNMKPQSNPPSEMDVQLALDAGEKGSNINCSGFDFSGQATSSPINQEDINHLSFRSVNLVNVQVRNLSVTVDVRPSITSISSLVSTWKGEKDAKVILDDINADMPAGELSAIIGGSGSGKTSMLNVMAHRMSVGSFTTTGAVTYNGQPFLRGISNAYVMQQDVLIPELTVRETLLYAAELRLPASTSHEERVKIVEEVIMQLGLKECADTPIGDNEHKGCSGGEKRRVSIGVQLLGNPSVLFLDEPTTGLDATSAHQLVKTLKYLARNGRTIITTIHQPRSEIWSLFDHITLLTRGKPLFSGPASAAIEYFADLGHSFPAHENPADFLIDLAAVDNRTPEAEEASTTRVNSLIAAWRQYTEKASTSGTRVVRIDDREKAEEQAVGSQSYEVAVTAVPFWRQLSVLTRRTFVVTYRDPLGMFGIFFEAICMSVIIGWIFFKLDGSLAGIRSKQAALYIFTSLQGYLVLLYEIYRLTSMEIKVFDRERGEGVVGVLSWLISRRIARLLTEDVTVPFIFSIITYFMVGFENDGAQFFRFFAVVLVGQYLAVTFATLSVGVSRDYSQATLVANLSFTLQSMTSGYFIQTNSIPVYVRWTRRVTYVFYSYAALCTNEFDGTFYDCPYGGPEEPRCLEYHGDFILVDQLGLKKNWYTVPMIIISSMAVIFYIIAGLLLRFWTVDINISKPRVNDSGDASSGKERINTNQQSEVQKIDVGLDDVKLNIVKRGILKSQNKKLEILKGVSTTFEAGKLNIIMGPSGSGKSTLLNLMAKRLRSTAITSYKTSGRMLFNGALPSDSVVRSLCSYVTQDDDALLPSLTVRETLSFAAGLRLPKWMSAEEKRRRAEDVLLKLGLKDCADNMIGSEFVKGISGGERRRVTIAVQILTEPKILLLDEPTSGLDAFTAASILSLLRALADEGRTIISTIHQSRAELFEQFGNVLLLARGGSVVYSGKATNMLPYFEACGYQCPSTTNPADFALDLITVDLQHEDRESTSREKVKRLIEDFHNQTANIAQASAIGSTSEPRHISLPAELGRMKREPAPFLTAYLILVHRGTLNLRRQPQIIIARLIQVLGLVIILALFFSPLRNDYYSVQNRVGVVQQVTSLYFVGMLQNIACYPYERDTFYKEHYDGIYSVTSFFLAYGTLELPFEIVTSLLFSVLMLFAIGLPHSTSLFFIMAFNAFCVVFAGESVGIIFNTLFSHTGFATNITSIVLSIGTIMAGPMSINMPEPLQRLNYLSPLRYMARNLLPYSLRGFKFTCTDEQRLPSGKCVLATGEQVLELYGMNKDKPEFMLGALAAAVVLYRLLAYLGLKAKMGERILRKVNPLDLTSKQ